jgi:hypothetical protein
MSKGSTTCGEPQLMPLWQLLLQRHQYGPTAPSLVVVLLLLFTSLHLLLLLHNHR